MLVFVVGAASLGAEIAAARASKKTQASTPRARKVPSTIMITPAVLWSASGEIPQ